MARVLVTDGEHRAALAVVRSLGGAGHTVEVAASSDAALATVSRFAQRKHLVPNPLADPRGYAVACAAIAREAAVDFVLPVTESSILALHESCEALPLLAPALEAFDRIRDKELVLECAQALGIATPRQVVVRNPGDASGLECLRFPVVIKPSRSIGGSGTTRTKSSVSYANDPSELERGLASLPVEVFPILLQEKIVGPGEGVFLLMHNGRAVAEFGHRRIREKPPSGGVSVCCESIPLDPQLVGKCEQLLAQFGWEGVAMVEFKRSNDDDEPYLMEINGRFWGSLQLAIDAGVDFPRLLLEVAQGFEPVGRGAYRMGLREHWEWGEVDHYLTRLKSEGLRSALPVFGDAVRAAIGTLRRGERLEVLRVRDPRPFLSESVTWIRTAVRGH